MLMWECDLYYKSSHGSMFMEWSAAKQLHPKCPKWLYITQSHTSACHVLHIHLQCLSKSPTEWKLWCDHSKPDILIKPVGGFNKIISHALWKKEPRLLDGDDRERVREHAVCVRSLVPDSACTCRCWARRTSSAMRTLGNSSSSSPTQRDLLWVSGLFTDNIRKDKRQV